MAQELVKWQIECVEEELKGVNEEIQGVEEELQGELSIHDVQPSYIQNVHVRVHHTRRTCTCTCTFPRCAIVACNA